MLQPRTQEVWERGHGFQGFDLRFDNEVHVRVGEFRRGNLTTWFALFAGADGAILSLPVGEAARHIGGNLGYRSVLIAGVPLRKTRSTPEAEAALERMKTGLGAKRGWVFVLSAEERELRRGAPAWNAGAELQFSGQFRGAFRPWDYSLAAKAIVENLDALKAFFVDSIGRARSPPAGRR